MALNYSIIDSNGNVELVTAAGTTGSGSAPTWSTTVPVGPTAGGNTTDNTATWADMGPAAVWAASTAYLKYHAIIVPVSGTNYIFADTTEGTTASSQPAYTATVGATVTDGTAVFTNEGVFGRATVFGGGTGDATNAASAGYCIYANDLTANGINITNTYCDHMGSGIRFNNVGNSQIVGFTTHDTQDGNGYGCLYEGGSGANDNKFYSLSCQTVGPEGYISGGGGGLEIFGGDMLGGWESGTEVASGGGWEFVNVTVRMATGDNESIGQTQIVNNNSSVDISNTGFTPQLPAFWPQITVASAGTVSIDRTTVSRTGVDFGVPLVQGLAAQANVSGRGVVINNGRIGAFDYGLSQQENYVGSITRISSGPQTTTGGMPAVSCENLGDDPMTGTNISGQTSLVFIYQTATPGVCGSIDLVYLGINGPIGPGSNVSAVANQTTLLEENSAVFTVAKGILKDYCQNSSSSNQCIPHVFQNDSTLVGAVLGSFQGAGSTPVVEPRSNGLYIAQPMLPNLTKTTVSCATSGSAIFQEPAAGISNKKILIHLTACLGAAAYTFPSGFVNTPGIFASSTVASSLVTSLSTTAVTVTGATSTGTIVLEDY